MPPVRRYLRITKYSVLECRIYVEKPTDVHRWLLNERSPVLPRVIEAVRPLVLPKLREENAKAKSGKGGKRRGWKDVVVEDDFEVAVFLTEISSRHAILHKEKRAQAEKPRLGSTESRLTGVGTRDVPVEIVDATEPVVLREESQEEKLPELAYIPPTTDADDAQKATLPAEDLSVSDSSDEAFETMPTRPNRRELGKVIDVQDPDADDKKKLGLRTLYDGFSIYERILCLVVKRRSNSTDKDLVGGAGQAMMEEWIASTQMPEGQMMDE
ncbi:MAG: hypothetical protein LQ346_004157 [Caloplaca aetnensis]|nr:MAG: hypothetical protein LQ346_004157 [Caloplaca aetnensis]